MATQTKFKWQTSRAEIREEATLPYRQSRWPLVFGLCLAVAAALILLGFGLSAFRFATHLGMPRAGLAKFGAIAIFTATYFAVAIGRIPGFSVDRAGAAFVGASLMVAFDVLPLKDAYQAIDFDTITLLLGVMIVVASLRLSGAFQFVSREIVKLARHPLTLLIAVVLLAGVLSAFLVNDAICLAMTPLVLDLVTQTKRNPVPYVLAVAMASNIGSTATITGNPQNMIIGSVSQIPYGSFAAALSPIAAMGLILTVLAIALAYRSEFLNWEWLTDDLPPIRANKPMMVKSALISLAMVVAFFVGVAPARAAVAAGALMLLSRHIKCHEIYQDVDWTLLLMFVGLFIVVAGLEKNVLTPALIADITGLQLQHAPVLSTVTALLSNLVSNVPAVLVLKPFVGSLGDRQHAWLTVAMASTLAGNFTVIGSVANLIVVQRARMDGIEISFWEYFKVGAPLTVLTIALGILFL